jgi:hypothetical protein
MSVQTRLNASPKAEVLKAAQGKLGGKIITEKQALKQDCSAKGSMLQILRDVWSREEGQDIAEYAVMLAVLQSRYLERLPGR